MILCFARYTRVTLDLADSDVATDIGKKVFMRRERWEQEAAKMRLASQLRKGHVVTRAQKDRYVRKAYRLLMETYAQAYWSLSEKVEQKNHSSRRILKTRRAIREHCQDRAAELMRACVSVREHRAALKELQAQVARQHKEAVKQFRHEQEERGEAGARPVRVKVRERKTESELLAEVAALKREVLQAEGRQPWSEQQIEAIKRQVEAAERQSWRSENGVA